MWVAAGVLSVDDSAEADDLDCMMGVSSQVNFPLCVDPHIDALAMHIICSSRASPVQEIDVMFATVLASDADSRGRRLSPASFTEACALLCFELHYSAEDLAQVQWRRWEVNMWLVTGMNLTGGSDW